VDTFYIYSKYILLVFLALGCVSGIIALVLAIVYHFIEVKPSKCIKGIILSLFLGIVSFLIAYIFLSFKVALISFIFSVIISFKDCVELVCENE